MEITISNGKHGAVYKDENCLPEMAVLESLLSAGYKMTAGGDTMSRAAALAFAQKLKQAKKRK